MNTCASLTVAKNAANKCSDLFRSLSKPGYAIFSRIAGGHIDKAAADATSAARDIDQVLADGRVDPSEVNLLRSAALRLHHIAG